MRRVWHLRRAGIDPPHQHLLDFAGFRARGYAVQPTVYGVERSASGRRCSSAFRRIPSIIYFSASNESDWGGNIEAVCDLIHAADGAAADGAAADSSRPVKTSWGYMIPRGPRVTPTSRAATTPAYSELTSELVIPTVYDEYNHLFHTADVDPGLRTVYGVSISERLGRDPGAAGRGRRRDLAVARLYVLRRERARFRSIQRGACSIAGGAKKPEYYNVKKAYSPVKLGEDATVMPAAGGIHTRGRKPLRPHRPVGADLRLELRGRIGQLHYAIGRAA